MSHPPCEFVHNLYNATLKHRPGAIVLPLVELVYLHSLNEHLYSPRVVEEIKKRKKWNIKQTNSDMA